jgi:hypothetical protein
MRTLELYSDVLSVLQWCVEKKLPISICSRCPSKTVAESALSAFGIWDWFSYPQVFNARSKSYHFRNLEEATGLKLRNFLFFDDEPSNVNTCNRIGVTTILVDKKQGLTWKNFLQGLESFQSKQLSRRSFSNWLQSSNIATNAMPSSSTPRNSIPSFNSSNTMFSPRSSVPCTPRGAKSRSHSLQLQLLSQQYERQQELVNNESSSKTGDIGSKESNTVISLLEEADSVVDHPVPSNGSTIVDLTLPTLNDDAVTNIEVDYSVENMASSSSSSSSPKVRVLHNVVIPFIDCSY